MSDRCNNCGGVIPARFFDYDHGWVPITCSGQCHRELSDKLRREQRREQRRNSIPEFMPWARP